MYKFRSCKIGNSNFKLFRILLYGIIRTIRPVGPLDGLLGGRFIVAFLSVLGILGAKGVFIAWVVVEYSSSFDLSLSTATMIITLQFIPQIILSVFTTIGFSANSMKLIPYHPETLLLSSGKWYYQNLKPQQFCYLL